MQVLGYVLYAIAGLEPVLDPDFRFRGHEAWLIAYGILGLAFHVGASTPGEAEYGAQRPFSPRRLAALGVMTPAMIAMAALMPCNFGALTLVVVASQAALAVPPRVALRR